LENYILNKKLETINLLYVCFAIKNKKKSHKVKLISLASVMLKFSQTLEIFSCQSLIEDIIDSKQNMLS